MPKKTSSVNDIFYYERSSGTMQREEVLGDRMLRLAYLSPLRSILRVPLFHASLFSRLAGVYADTRLSCRRIEPTIRQLNINMDDFVVPEGGYKSFNEFFCRKLRMGARLFDLAPDALCSPADCRIKVWPVLPDGICFPIKGRTFSVAELLGDENRKLAERFIGGSLCICRLCPADYHRYHFPADGRIVSHWKLKGNYHSVNPMVLAQNIAVFNQNAREVTILKLKNEDVDCAFVEVGAFGVGSINQTKLSGSFAKGDEKGSFTFGGSTVIMVFAPGAVSFDEDLVQKSQEDVECLVKCGEHIGVFL